MKSKKKKMKKRKKILITTKENVKNKLDKEFI